MTINSERLAGRVAVVTGGGSGIGLATVRRFKAEGATIVVGDIDPVTGEKAAGEVGGLYVKVDVSDEEQVKNLFNAAEAAYGAVDIAFNNAGVSPPEDASILDTDIEIWHKVQRINLTSVFLCSKYAIEHMRKRGKGSAKGCC